MDADSNRCVKVMADYDCYPIWDAGSSGPANLDPLSLPISKNLNSCFLEWAQCYNKTLEASNPEESGFSSVKKHQLFVDEGWSLAKRLAEELGESWSVFYFDDLNGETRPVGEPRQ